MVLHRPVELAAVIGNLILNDARLSGTEVRFALETCERPSGQQSRGGVCPSLCRQHQSPAAKLFNNKVVRKGLAKSGMGHPPSADILGCLFWQINECDVAMAKQRL
jgi:hypothetical protein